jgi:hypothetical protein
MRRVEGTADKLRNSRSVVISNRFSGEKSAFSAATTKADFSLCSK